MHTPARSARANGIDLTCDSFGNTDDPPLLLIMGLGTQMIGWDEGFCAQLAAHGRYVVRVDLSGAKPKVTRFATGFDHPLAVLFLKDGAMLVADWGTGIVWRVAR